MVEPIHGTVHIDSRCRSDVLQVGFGLSPITRRPEAKGSHALGKGPLNTGSPGVLLFAFFTGMMLPGFLESFVLGLGEQFQVTTSSCGPGTEATRRTRATVRREEVDGHRRSATGRDLFAPSGREFALRTTDLLTFPIDTKLVQIIASLKLGLPTRIRARRTLITGRRRLPLASGRAPRSSRLSEANP